MQPCRRCSWVLAALLAFGAAAATARAAASDPQAALSGPPDATPAPVRELAVAIQKVTLDNGVRLVLDVTPGAATCASAALYEQPHSERPDAATRQAQAALHERGGRFTAESFAGSSSEVVLLPNREIEFALWFAAERWRQRGIPSVLALVGDFDVDSVVPWAKGYLASLPGAAPGATPGAPVKNTAPAAAPPAAAAALPELTWTLALSSDEASHALELTLALLEKRARLATLLLQRGGPPLELHAEREGSPAKPSFTFLLRVAAAPPERPIWEVPSSPTQPAALAPTLQRSLQARLNTELQRLATEPVSGAELSALKQQQRRAWLARLESNAERALLLARLEARLGNARLVANELARYAAPDNNALRSAAKRLLTALTARRQQDSALGNPQARTP